MQNKTKIWIGFLSAGAIAIGGIKAQEGLVLRPYRDSVGIPTIGHGTTVYEDGTRVKLTDKPITPERADRLLRAHVAKDEYKLKQSLPGVMLSQTEYDVYVDFAYQYGMAAFNRSSIRRHLLAGNHAAACRALLKYRYAGGRDCSIKRNNCYGVWKRQLERYNRCISVN